MKNLVLATMGLVAVAAFALSFQSLMTLGGLAGYGSLDWLYPVVVDLGTVSSCATWLGSRSKQAFWMTWSLLTISVLQNGTVHWLIATAQKPEWWLVTLVATVPPIVLGLTIHLGVGIGRNQATAAKAERELAERARQRAAERKVTAPVARPPERAALAGAAPVDDLAVARKREQERLKKQRQRAAARERARSNG